MSSPVITWDGMDEHYSRPGSARPDDLLSLLSDERREKNGAHPEPIVRNKLSAVYPYTPLPENFLDEPGGGAKNAVSGVDGNDCSENSKSNTTTLGCAKYGLWNCRYQEDATGREFMRFCHRSLDGTYVIFAYGAGAQTVGTDWDFGWLIMCLGAGLLATAATDLALHCIYRAGTAFTYKVAASRQVATIVGGILICCVSSFLLRINNLKCNPDNNWKALHGYERPSKVEYLSCTRSINAYGPSCVIFALCTISLHIYAHFFVVGVHVVLSIFGEILVVVSRPETPGLLTYERDGERAIRILIILSCACISCLVAFAKHRFKQRSFEAAMEVHYAMRASKRKMDAVDSLMVSMIPASALTRLLEGERVFDYTPHATVLFSDMVQFTKWSSVRSPQQVVALLSVLVREFDMLAAEMKVSKVKTIGDCYWAVTGIPDHMDRHAEVMIRFGLQMLTLVREEGLRHPEWDYPLEPGQHASAQRQLVQFRTGIHSGPVEAGVLGTQQISYEIFGETSTAANRVEANGQPDRVAVSRRTKRLAEGHELLPFHFAPFSSDSLRKEIRGRTFTPKKTPASRSLTPPIVALNDTPSTPDSPATAALDGPANGTPQEQCVKSTLQLALEDTHDIPETSLELDDDMPLPAPLSRPTRASAISLHGLGLSRSSRTTTGGDSSTGNASLSSSVCNAFGLLDDLERASPPPRSPPEGKLRRRKTGAATQEEGTGDPTTRIGEEEVQRTHVFPPQNDPIRSYPSSDADSDDDDDDADPCSTLYLVVPHTYVSPVSAPVSVVKSPEPIPDQIHSQEVRPKADEDRAREQRKKYVETHLLKSDEGKDGGANQLSEATKDELMEQLKTRKYCCGILAFADETVEAEFKAFAVSELIEVRLRGMIAITAFWLVYFFMFLADAATEFSAAALLLTVAAHTTLAISTLLTFRRWQELTRLAPQRSVEGGEDGDEGPSVPPTAQVELQTLGDYVAPSLAQFAGFLWFCSAIIAPDSIITNDNVWVAGSLVMLVQLPANHWPSLVLSGVFLVYDVGIVINIYMKSHRVVTNVNIVVVGTSIVCILLIVNEKRLRVQFLESKVATHFAAKQLVAAKAQEAVLTSMLPDFVIAPLTNWIGSNFDPAKTVVQTLDNVSVAFVRLSAGARSRSFRCSPTDRGHDALRERAMDWLFAGHKAVDVVLSTTKAVEKVKTVGDLIIVAGSFRGHSPAQAAAAMLSAMVRIHGEFDKESVSIGLHVGPVQGIVLGFSRLAFDIFGDTVNTASRVMSHPESRNRIVASTSYLEQLPNAPSTVRSPAANFVSPARADETVEYGPPVEIAAKGKGVLCVREIQHAV